MTAKGHHPLPQQQLTFSRADIIWCGEKDCAAQDFKAQIRSLGAGWRVSLSPCSGVITPCGGAAVPVSDLLVYAQCHFSPPKWPLSKNKQPGNNLKHAPSTQLLGLLAASAKKTSGIFTLLGLGVWLRVGHLPSNRRPR